MAMKSTMIPATGDRVTYRRVDFVDPKVTSHIGPMNSTADRGVMGAYRHPLDGRPVRDFHGQDGCTGSSGDPQHDSARNNGKS
jgi:hypothetical protein